MDGYNAEIICRLYTFLDEYEEQLDGLFTWDFMARIAEEFKGSEWEDLDMDLDSALKEYAEDNIDKWIRQLNGDNLYKVKVVLEFDVESADKLHTVVSNVKELFYDKSVEDYGCDAIKDVRVINAVGKEVDE